MSEYKDLMYGVIEEDSIRLRTPRIIDSDECKTIEGAFKAALDMLRDGQASKVSIVRCRYSAAHEGYAEVYEHGCIQIEAGQWKEFDEED